MDINRIPNTSLLIRLHGHQNAFSPVIQRLDLINCVFLRAESPRLPGDSEIQCLGIVKGKWDLKICSLGGSSVGRH